MARLYRSQARPSVAAIAAMVCAALGAALLLAVGWRWLGAYGELIFAGTIVRGLIIGALLTWVVRKSNFAKPLAAGAIAALATLCAIVGARYEAHTRHRAAMMQSASELLLISTGAGSDMAEAEEHYRNTRAELSFGNYLRGYYGFTGQAEDGSAALWGPWAGLALYGLEIAAALGLATCYPVGQAREPVCPRCSRWREEKVLGQSAHGKSQEFTAHLLDSNTEAATSCLASPDTGETTELVLARCGLGHDDGKGGVLRVRDHVYERGNRELRQRDRADVSVDQGEVDAIIASMEAWA